MIPPSTGKSPKIDKFYETLRSFKTSHLEVSQKMREHEQKSIDRIRSLGKQILGQQKTVNKKNQESIIGKLNRSVEKVQKYNNLYDKYKRRGELKDQMLIDRRKDKILRQNTSSKEKLWKDKKYETVGPKVGHIVKKGLNYVKRTDMKAQELKQIKNKTQHVKQEIKGNQQYYNKKVRYNKDKQFGGVIQRSKQMQFRKTMSIEKIKRQLSQKQMENVTFTPQRVSKDILKSPSSFMKRTQANEIHKLSKQKYLLQEQIKSKTFHPYINPSHQVPSIIKGIWQAQEERNKSQKEVGMISEEMKEEQEQPTMHSTTRITLKNMDELSFMLE